MTATFVASTDWDRFGVASRDLAQEIADSGFRPDIILAIARGGMFVAGALGYALSVKNLHLMNVEFYNGVGTTLEMPVMLPPVPSAVDFSAKKVLIADDVADTGRTLELVHDFVSGHVAEVRSAVIYEKPQSLIKCDYVWKRTDAWINFPWSSQQPVVRARRSRRLSNWSVLSLISFGIIRLLEPPMSDSRPVLLLMDFQHGIVERIADAAVVQAADRAARPPGPRASR